MFEEFSWLLNTSGMILAGSHLCPTRSQCLAYKQFLRQKLLIQILNHSILQKMEHLGIFYI